MRMTHQPVIKQPGEGRMIGVVGDVYRFMATSEDTNGKYAMCEAIVQPSGGTPPHIHSREEEAFFILEGEIAFYLGEERLVARAGMFANMPIGSQHCFKNETQKPATADHSRSCRTGKDVLRIAQPVVPGATSAPPPTKEIIDKLIAIAPSYGIEIKLPPH